jgi:hypothetical protein
MLHVTNGSVVVTRLHDLGLPGQVLPWDDVLHEGPVRADADRATSRRERARLLAAFGSETAEEIERHFARRDDTLDAAFGEDEIVLWFEHDLYDQLQLLQVLDRLPDPGPRITAVLAGDYLGAQSAEQLTEWFHARTAVTREQRRLASRAWDAFRSPDPAALVALCRAEPSGSAIDSAIDSVIGPAASSPIPHLLPALRRHLQQFPSAANGLSRTEAQTLTAVAAGAGRVPQVFLAANHRVEDAIFMGDAAWWWHVRPLLAGPRPLLGTEGPAPADWTDPAWWDDEDAASPRLVLTPDGERVMSGAADHVALNGIDRWLGGVHLTTAGPQWRYDATHQKLVRA